MSRTHGFTPNLVDEETGEPVIDRVRRLTPEVNAEFDRFAIPAGYFVRHDSSIDGVWVDRPEPLQMRDFVSWQPLYVTQLFQESTGIYWAELSWRSRMAEINGQRAARSRIVPLSLIKSGRSLAAFLRGSTILAPGAGGSRIERYLAEFISQNQDSGALLTRPVQPAPPIPTLSAAETWKAIDAALVRCGARRSGRSAPHGRSYEAPIPGAGGDPYYGCLYIGITIKREVKFTIDRINAPHGPADEQEDWYREHLDPRVRVALASMPGTSRRNIGWLPTGGDVYLIAEPIARAHAADLIGSWLERELFWSARSTLADGDA